MNIKKVLISLLSIGAVTIVAVMATSAFFNDKETSTGNVLVAGALDLKIDNTCYYNGLACVPALGPDDQELGYSVWSSNPRAGDPNGEKCSCTWESKDLEEGDVFFDLHDLKPGDWEEDTISIDVDNPSWLCADIRQTRDADNSCTEPEQDDEAGLCVDPDGNGELAENLQFVFWEDDGDNVYECRDRQNCEKILTKGPASDVLGSKTWALADSSTDNGPIGPDTYYIGKFFCFGEIGFSPKPLGDGSPLVRGSGFTCNGKPLDNKSQTDSLEGDITFYAEQARHNEKFLCESAPPPSPTPKD
jgi:predicted ribosomally synthesized peptide with SipW-like signal peptide